MWLLPREYARIARVSSLGPDGRRWSMAQLWHWLLVAVVAIPYADRLLDLLWLLIPVLQAVLSVMPLLFTLNTMGLIPSNIRTFFRARPFEDVVQMPGVELELLAAHTSWRLSQDAKSTFFQRISRWANTAAHLAQHAVNGEIQFHALDFIIFIFVIASSEVDGHVERRVLFSGLGHSEVLMLRNPFRQPPNAQATAVPVSTTSAASSSRPANWMRDDEATACVICHKSFTLMIRRHHCRGCGRLVCSSCAPKRAKDNAALERRCDACFFSR